MQAVVLMLLGQTIGSSAVGALFLMIVTTQSWGALGTYFGLVFPAAILSGSAIGYRQGRARDRRRSVEVAPAMRAGRGLLGAFVGMMAFSNAALALFFLSLWFGDAIGNPATWAGFWEGWPAAMGCGAAIGVVSGYALAR